MVGNGQFDGKKSGIIFLAKYGPVIPKLLDFWPDPNRPKIGIFEKSRPVASQPDDMTSLFFNKKMRLDLLFKMLGLWQKFDNF